MSLVRATRRVLMGLGAAVAVAGAPAAYAVAIAHWSFDTTQGDKNVYPDTVGNGHPATPSKVEQVKPFPGIAPFGNAVMFSTENNQKNSFLTIPPINNMQKTSLTVAAWVYLTKTHANFVITDWKASSDAAWVFGVDLPKAGAPKATPIGDLRSGDTDPGTTNASRKGLHYSIARYAEAKKDVPLNEWHHLAWTWNRTSGMLTSYLDAEVLGTAKEAHTPLDLTPAKNMMRIGGREANNYNMDGAIDELWIYNEALTQDQIKNVMRYNTMEGTGPLARVLMKNGDGTVALANPAPPVANPPPKPATPVATGNPRPPRNTGGAAARGNTPRPGNSTPAAPGVAATPGTPPAPTVDEHPMDLSGLGGTAVTANGDPGPEPAPQTAADEDPNPTPLTAIASEVVASGNTPVARVLPRHFTSRRVAGVISCATLAVVLGAYLFWALSERAKIRAAR